MANIKIEDYIIPNNKPSNFIRYNKNISQNEVEDVHNLKCREGRIYGGSFFNAPSSDEFLTINLMEEYPLPCDIYLPIEDFSIPTKNQIKEMIDIFEYIQNTSKKVYVGCFGGIGRTGLFMASFLKYLGDENPLVSVREQFNPKAVETLEQFNFIKDFPTRQSLLNIEELEEGENGVENNSLLLSSKFKIK